MKRGLVFLMLISVFLISCTQSQTIITIEGTNGCGLIPDSEFEAIVAPEFVKECEKRCSAQGATYTEWKCSDEDLLTCYC